MNEALKTTDLSDQRIHALSLKTYSPAQWENSARDVRTEKENILWRMKSLAKIEEKVKNNKVMLYMKVDA